MATTTKSTVTAKNGPPPRPRISAQDSLFATVLVGPQQARFLVHEALLVHYSEFFRAALTGKFKEAEDKVVKLEEDCPKIFEIFVHWLYYERFPDVNKGDDEQLLRAWGSVDHNATITANLIEMYVLGDQRLIPQLQRATLDYLFRHMRRPKTITPNQEHFSYAFKHLPADDPLCRYMIDVNLYYDRFDEGKSPYEIEDLGGWPEAYLLGFARRASHMIASVRWDYTDIGDFSPKLCDYHGHRTDQERKDCEQEQQHRDEQIKRN